MTQTGIGGSESAIVYVAQELSRRGWAVTVFANPPSHSLWTDRRKSPCYVQASSFPSGASFDVVVCWRRQDFALARRAGEKVFFWPHDLPTPRSTADSMQNDSSLTGIFYLSAFQRQEFDKISLPLRKSLPSVIAGNGIDTSRQLTDKQLFAKPPGSCVYISNWARGLEHLLGMWPRIRAAVPTATLDIFYGPQTWGLWDAHKTRNVLIQIQNLQSLGVQNRGMVGHILLDKALEQASILAYPCHCYAETYCISAVKAQHFGLIPVVTRMGALAETVHPDAPTLPAILHLQHVQEYEQLLIKTLQRVCAQSATPLGLVQERRKYINFAQNKTWAQCVESWLSIVI